MVVLKGAELSMEAFAVVDAAMAVVSPVKLFSGLSVFKPCVLLNFSMPRSVIVLMMILFALFGYDIAHEDHGEAWSCARNENVVIHSRYRPGKITLDGNADDWSKIDGFDFTLFPALTSEEENKYKGGKMTVKSLHDGNNIFFLLQVGGDYIYKRGETKKCPSVALMFPVGVNATYYNMGGCQESKTVCSHTTCRGHEVDIMHFSVGSAVPGQLYGASHVDGGNGADRFGNLVDLYAWNPHCLFHDGSRVSVNDTTADNNIWKGAWWHDSLNVHSGGFIEEDSPFGSSGMRGTYYFEFCRSLSTTDHFQQDVQFKIGQTTNFAAAFWYPDKGNPWRGSQHYSISCGWVPLVISSSVATSSWNIATVIAIILSCLSFCTSIFVWYWGCQAKHVSFTPINNI